MRKLSLILCFFLFGCTGYNAYINKHLPAASAKKVIVSTDIPGAVHLSIEATNVIKDGNEIVADVIKYDSNKFGATTHVYLEGYSRTIPEEDK